MTLIEFRRAMRRQPFRSFTLVLVDGQRFTIDHPEFASIDRRGRVITFQTLDETYHEINTQLVVDLVWAGPRGAEVDTEAADPEDQP